jgi:hypothetical protein
MSWKSVNEVYKKTLPGILKNYQWKNSLAQAAVTFYSNNTKTGGIHG